MDIASTRRYLGLGALILAAACAAPAPHLQQPPVPLTQTDLRRIERLTFGVDTATVARYQAIGRERFLDEQLAPPRADPPELARAIAALAAIKRSALETTREARDERKRVEAMTDADAQRAARTALNRSGNEMLLQIEQRHLMRALYSPAQLREQMTWFWMNHFSVFSQKSGVRWALAEYEERAVRPRALGKFRDLVLATVRSPAMLEYLDNAQSAAGRINENYARELMELHTLGVSGGPSGSTYTQRDVQELARVLTGVGVNPGDAPNLGPGRRSLYVHDGLTEFNPNRHDFGDKVVLGETIAGRGFAEIEQAVALLCRQPATARFIAHKLAVYFVADEPPGALVDTMTATFLRTDGDIAQVLRTMFTSREFDQAIARDGASSGKFKDPMQFVVSSLRFAYDGRPIVNVSPAVVWLRELGEPLYGRVTPDGWPSIESAWSSPGQRVKRFEIARAIGCGNAPLFKTGDAANGGKASAPVLDNALFAAAIAPSLSKPTRDALAQTRAPAEWNTTLLASPDWMHR